MSPIVFPGGVALFGAFFVSGHGNVLIKTKAVELADPSGRIPDIPLLRLAGGPIRQDA